MDSLSLYYLFVGAGLGVGYTYGQSIYGAIRSKGDWPFVFLYGGTIVCSWAGAKVFFLLFSMGENKWAHILSLNFWWGGGFVFYGGFIGGAAYLLVYNAFIRRGNLYDFAFFLPVLTLGHALGRVGCFFGGCCHGRVCSVGWCLRHPVQLYEAVFLLVLTWILRRVVRKGESAQVLLSVYLCSYGMGRFILEFFRGDTIRGIYGGFSTSQYVSVFLFILGMRTFPRKG